MFRKLPNGIRPSEEAHKAIERLEELGYNGSEPFGDGEEGKDGEFSYLYPERHVELLSDDPLGALAIGRLCYWHILQTQASPAIMVLYNPPNPLQIIRALRFRKKLIRHEVPFADCYDIPTLISVYDEYRGKGFQTVRNNIVRVLTALRKEPL